MKTMDELSQRMRTAGLRVTPQRRCIVELLAGDSSHPTVESLYERAQARMPTISLKTVYQTVHELEALGELRVLDVGTGSLRVDPNVEAEHHHLVCSKCGRVRDVSVDVDAVRLHPKQRRDFSVHQIDVIYRGRCSRCES